MSLPEKKAAVFRAVLGLLRQGRPLGDLKVSEIAEAAGIGKGTVYEYFPSREELLRDAMQYSRAQGFGELLRRVTVLFRSGASGELLQLFAQCGAAARIQRRQGLRRRSWQGRSCIQHAAQRLRGRTERLFHKLPPKARSGAACYGSGGAQRGFI